MPGNPARLCASSTVCDPGSTPTRFKPISTSINVRTLLETDDGALISMTYAGVRHGPQDILDAIARGESVNPNAYYMRVVPAFETASETYDWLNRVVAVAQGHRLSNGAIYNVFEII